LCIKSRVNWSKHRPYCSRFRKFIVIHCLVSILVVSKLRKLFKFNIQPCRVFRQRAQSHLTFF
jgi:hypothetical protein